MSPDIVLRVRGLEIAYEARTVIRDCNFELPAASGLLLTGQNGAGKSTLLRCIAGLVTGRTGEILLRGESIWSWPAERRARIGISSSLQGQRVFPNLSVCENIMAALYLSDPGRGKVVVDEMMQLFPDLEARRKVRGADLNGGARQLLAVAMAISRTCCGARLLLLDEPSLGLDENNTERVTNAITAAVNDGASVLMAEHDMRFQTAFPWQELRIGDKLGMERSA
jgi:ABC-type branched-subunit amino acid transport system ATPase component